MFGGLKSLSLTNICPYLSYQRVITNLFVKYNLVYWVTNNNFGENLQNFYKFHDFTREINFYIIYESLNYIYRPWKSQINAIIVRKPTWYYCMINLKIFMFQHLSIQFLKRKKKHVFYSLLPLHYNSTK